MKMIILIWVLAFLQLDKLPNSAAGVSRGLLLPAAGVREVLAAKQLLRRQILVFVSCFQKGRFCFHYPYELALEFNLMILYKSLKNAAACSLFSKVFHIITSCSAPGVKELMLQVWVPGPEEKKNHIPQGTSSSERRYPWQSHRTRLSSLLLSPAARLTLALE